ncbi:MAG: alpha/beta hydrolase, partial [Chloroflexi bacterium]|nr:alpha/beta hydrolase [Chloroflexota bacterium]
MSYISVNGTQLYYEEFGTGEEIVVAAQMGFADDGYPRCLAEHPLNYHVYQLTLRGHGRSGPPRGNLGPGWWQQWADDVHAFVGQLGHPRVIYTGISHGAGLGWHLVISYPEIIKAFVAVVGAPLPRIGTSDIRARRKQALGDPAR